MRVYEKFLALVLKPLLPVSLKRSHEKAREGHTDIPDTNVCISYEFQTGVSGSRVGCTAPASPAANTGSVPSPKAACPPGCPISRQVFWADALCCLPRGGGLVSITPSSLTPFTLPPQGRRSDFSDREIWEE